MNENIDLTKILDGCPVGTEFYHAGYSRVWFVGIDLNSNYPIKLSLHNDDCIHAAVSAKGTLDVSYNGECLLVPSKDQRDWSKFVRFWDKSSRSSSEERFDPKTLQPFDKVLVKDYSNDVWTACLFSHPATNTDKGWFICDNTYWHYIIPYNDDTKHLVGTRDDCPEYYKWWEE